MRYERRYITKEIKVPCLILYNIYKIYVVIMHIFIILYFNTEHGT